jgi:ubiquinol-cytochrome c reductase cytochrome c1 subunit
MASVRRAILGAATAVMGLGAVLFVAASPTQHAHVETQNWSFQGFFGSFDRAQVKRGFHVYKEVCANCHSMNLLSYRSLEAIGFTEDEVKEIAASVQVADGPDENGEMFERAGKASDKFKAPFANEQAARAANNGALPPDLSLIAKSRAGKGFGAYDGADYIHSLLVGYEDAPADFKLGEGMNYNRAFKGNQIAMPQPLADGAVIYADGTEATLDQEAKDVAVFLTWASETELEARHRTGIKTFIFLVVLTLFAYAAKRRVWAKIH